MRCLGIDYGSKRIGLSHADELGVAIPLAALIDADAREQWRKLSEIVHQRRITDLVIGYPYNLDGTVGFKAREVDAFVEKLVKEFGLPVHRVDETLTSYVAESSIGAPGMLCRPFGSPWMLNIWRCFKMLSYSGL